MLSMGDREMSVRRPVCGRKGVGGSGGMEEWNSGFGQTVLPSVASCSQ